MIAAGADEANTKAQNRVGLIISVGPERNDITIGQMATLLGIEYRSVQQRRDRWRKRKER